MIDGLIEAIAEGEGGEGGGEVVDGLIEDAFANAVRICHDELGERGREVIEWVVESRFESDLKQRRWKMVHRLVKNKTTFKREMSERGREVVNRLIETISTSERLKGRWKVIYRAVRKRLVLVVI